MHLYEYQKTGVAWLLEHGSGLLADEVGLGKTIMTLKIMGITKPFPALILCPAILKWQWYEEIRKFLPNVKAVVIEGSAMERAKLWNTDADVKIANYELLLRDINYVANIHWELFVCDEATRIANPWTKTYKALYNIQSKHRIALTGTPISNRPNEIWGILNWCYPTCLGKYRAFLDRYCIYDYFGGISRFKNLEELKQRIAPLMIRRLREDVLPELPEKIISNIPIVLSDKERALYTKIRKELLYEIEHSDISKLENPVTIQNTLTKMLRLRQAANSLELLGENKESAKLQTLKELLPALLNGERKAIIFTFFSSMANILERELKEWTPLKITGEVKQREDIVKKFNEDSENRILVMTSAGQYGLNIQAASVVIHYDQEWSLAKMSQREGRAHRIGQKNTVLVYNLLAKGTVDEYISRVLRKKQQLSRDILGDGIGAEEIKEILTYGVN